MARKLTANQVAALEHVEREGDATIQEVADSTGMHYSTASQALSRLWSLDAISKEKLGDGTNKVVYRSIVLENPNSDDPLEKLFCAPAAEVEH